jgi:hypothetical protein
MDALFDWMVRRHKFGSLLLLYYSSLEVSDTSSPSLLLKSRGE